MVLFVVKVWGMPSKLLLNMEQVVEDWKEDIEATIRRIDGLFLKDSDKIIVLFPNQGMQSASPDELFVEVFSPNVNKISGKEKTAKIVGEKIKSLYNVKVTVTVSLNGLPTTRCWSA